MKVLKISKKEDLNLLPKGNNQNESERIFFNMNANLN
jgi:hypothetical protein